MTKPKYMRLKHTRRVFLEKDSDNVQVAIANMHVSETYADLSFVLNGWNATVSIDLDFHDERGMKRAQEKVRALQNTVEHMKIFVDSAIEAFRHNQAEAKAHAQTQGSARARRRKATESVGLDA